MGGLFKKISELVFGAALWAAMAMIAAAQTSDLKVDGPTNLSCAAGQTLWVYEIGDRGTVAAPQETNYTNSAASFEIWGEGDNATLVGHFVGLPKLIQSGMVLERFSPKQGVASVQLGDFADQWPVTGAALTRTGETRPSANSGANNFSTELERTNFLQRGEVADMSDYLRAPDFNGKLSYFIEAKAQLEYLRMAICSDAPSPKAVEPEPAPEPKPEPEPSTPSETVPAPPLESEQPPPSSPAVEPSDPPPAPIIPTPSGTLIGDEVTLAYGFGDLPPQETSLRVGESAEMSGGGDAYFDAANNRSSLADIDLGENTIRLTFPNLQFGARAYLAFSDLTPAMAGCESAKISNAVAITDNPNANYVSSQLTFTDNAVRVPLAGNTDGPANVWQAGQSLEVSLQFVCADQTTAPSVEVDPPKPLSPLWIGAGLALAAAAIFAVAKLAGGASKGGKLPRAPRSSNALRGRPDKPEDSGLVFLESAMVPGAVPVAASGAGAGNLAQLSGVYQALRPAYHATGRIGFAQKGKPSSDDIAFGTGFLISDKHVMTNRHVYEMYREYLLGDDCAGIEFYAEKDKDKTEFISFTGEPPRFVPGIDIVIFTLGKAISKRAPIPLLPIAIETLDSREVVLIGYPCPRRVTEEIAAVVEDNPIFAVKRLSEGSIFRHSSDTDKPFGVDVPVSDVIHPQGIMPAICHNASTTGGSSGSPVLDKSTGELLGVHFGFDVAFDWAEAANFAMAIETIQATLEAAQNDA